MIIIEVILVDKDDKIIGTEEKIKAHKNGGKLHRAFSIFIFNNQNELLIQRRSFNKYHSGGLWSNSCCSHPSLGVKIIVSAEKRLKQELGFVCKLKRLFKFKYEVHFENGLTEKEIDYVFVGICNKNIDINPNPKEVNEWRWISYNKLKKNMEVNNEKYTHWFKLSLDKVIQVIK